MALILRLLTVYGIGLLFPSYAMLWAFQHSPDAWGILLGTAASGPCYASCPSSRQPLGGW